MHKHYWAFWYALALLSRVPVPALRRTDAAVATTSLLYYPLVGLLLGLALLALTAACLLYNPAASPLLVGALLLALWVGFTGALHLDGLADSADAWVGGLGDRERTLAIMKDPRSGPMGVTAIVVILLLKLAALVALLEQAQHLSGGNLWLLGGGLLLIPALARGGLVGLMASLPYARAQGMVSALQHGVRGWRLAVLGTVLALLSGVLLQQQAMLVLLLWLLLLLTARQQLQRRLGGYTGDTLGALVEVQEAVLLAALALG